MAAVTVDNISKSYGKVQAVKDFSFSINKGEIYALVGPDGAGKTTTMRAMCGLIGIDSGTIEIFGKNAITEFEAAKQMLGYMPQTFSLYPDLSVEENLDFYGGIYGITGGAFRKQKEYLYGFSNLKPFGNRRAEALSGGMKQKLALSCALLHNPELLVLDEPTTGVDPLSRRQFWDILLTLRKNGATIVVATPYMDEVARADKASFVFGGQVLASGTPEELTHLFNGNVFAAEIAVSPTQLDQVNAIPGIGARRFGASVHLYLEPGHTLAEFTASLAQVGIAAERFTQVKPDLEDCFIQLMEKQHA